MRPLIATCLALATLLPATAPATEVATAHLQVKGMACDACRLKVDKALKDVTGVQDAEVDIKGGTATVHFDPTQTSRDAIAEAATRAGFASEVKNPGSNPGSGLHNGNVAPPHHTAVEGEQ